MKYKIREFFFNLKKNCKRKEERGVGIVQELEQLKTLHESHPSQDTLNRLKKVKTDLKFLEEKKVEGSLLRPELGGTSAGKKVVNTF